MREIEGALGALKPPFGLILRRLLAIEVGDRGPAAHLQRGIAVEVGRGLLQT
jgi:hypothetical protein